MDRDLSNTSMSRARGERVEINHSLENAEVNVNQIDVSVEKIINSHIAPNRAQERVESIIKSAYDNTENVAVWVRSPSDGADFILVELTSQDNIIDYNDLVDSLPNHIHTIVETSEGDVTNDIDVYVKNGQEKTN